MSRSFVKLILVLLLVGVLPFAASLVIVDDLFSQAAAVGLNPQVRQHLLQSAQAHRLLFEAEQLAHRLTADRIASDPRWAEITAPSEPGTQPSPAYRTLLASFANLHPRLLGLSLHHPDWTEPLSIQLPNEELDPAEPQKPEPVTRQEVRTVPATTPPMELVLTFGLPAEVVAELERIGDTLGTFRALETLQEEFTRGLRRTYLTLAGAAVLLALLLGTLLTRQTTRQLGQIAQAARQVAAGDLTVRLPIRSRDELGALARQFNAMVEELQSNQERIAYLQRVSTWQEIARRLAHEIKNPLTPILLATQELARKYEDLNRQPERFRPVLKDVLEIVQEEVGTLQTLVREFSEFARLPRPEPRTVPLAGFLSEFLKTNPQLTQRAEISLHLDPGAASILAAIDPVLMRRVLVNLVENAIEASSDRPDGSPPLPEVTLWLRAASNLALIEVVDRGRGLDPSQLAHLFEPYFTTKEGGTGLGLAIVKKIVVDHQGTVQIAEREDAPGCRVTIALPQAQPPANPSRQEDPLRGPLG
ncbi:MAG: HAMP domain-containing protein [Bradymonadales bacterium]|nr:HAMP domain-containing protein [Bradymonadales bacterium]